MEYHIDSYTCGFTSTIMMRNVPLLNQLTRIREREGIGMEKTKGYNEPEHYHKHALDTIEFLQKGFPPDVFLHFALANVIKYAQRAEYKNGLEDLDKMVDYATRARDWYKRRWTNE